jgi:hypothetical protein
MHIFDVKPGDTITRLEDGSLLGPVRIETTMTKDGSFMITARMQVAFADPQEEVERRAREYLKRVLEASTRVDASPR